MLGTLPLVFLAEIGFAVALGVLLDTLIVRSVLVTALNLDLGGKIWWPSKLDRGDHAVDRRAEPEREAASRSRSTDASAAPWAGRTGPGRRRLA